MVCRANRLENRPGKTARVQRGHQLSCVPHAGQHDCIRGRQITAVVKDLRFCAGGLEPPRNRADITGAIINHPDHASTPLVDGTVMLVRLILVAW